MQPVCLNRITKCGIENFENVFSIYRKIEIVDF